MVPVSNIVTGNEENFYLSEVGPNLHFSLKARNILDAEVWVNEKGYISIKDIDKYGKKGKPQFNSNTDNSIFAISQNKDVTNSINQIKIYVPLDSEHINEGVKRIFTFLAENNISHSSKVRDRTISCDNIVIRLDNVRDAKKLSEFIKCDEYIQSGLLECSPFTFNDNGISYLLCNKTIPNCEKCSFDSTSLKCDLCDLLDYHPDRKNNNKKRKKNFSIRMI